MDDMGFFAGFGIFCFVIILFVTLIGVVAFVYDAFVNSVAKKRDFKTRRENDVLKKENERLKEQNEAYRDELVSLGVDPYEQRFQSAEDDDFGDVEDYGGDLDDDESSFKNT